MFFKRRAQSSAPIELVVAVIILIASMSLAFMVLQSTQSAQCVDKLRADMRGLQNIMLDVALGSPSTSRVVDLQLQSCGDLNLQAIRIVYYNKREYCGRCGSTGSGCWVIEPLTLDANEKRYFPVYEASTCIPPTLPGKAELVSDEECQATAQSSVTTNACPDSADSNDPNCVLPASVAEQTQHLLTLAKTPGETQYRVFITKGIGTIAGNPVLKVCFLDKRSAAQREQEIGGS